MSQSSLTQFEDSPDDFREGISSIVSGLYGRVRNTLARIGLDSDWMGRSPTNLDDTDREIWVYQYVTAYSKGRLGERYDWSANKGGRDSREGSPSPSLQFKTGIYVLGEPTEELKHRIKSIDNGRLRTLFNTREYAGYVDGFGFTEKREYTQLEEVSSRDVTSKGVSLGQPWFEVEAYDDDGNLQGFADGTFNPFTTESYIEEWETGDEIPDQEVWRVRTGLNRARNAGGQWEIGPEQNTGASERTLTEQVRGKDVYIGPFKVGKVTSRGTTWLRREYDNGGPYVDKKTITSSSGIPPQALQKGAKLYKYEETEDAIRLSTSKPPTGFDPLDADEISRDQTGIEKHSEEVTEILIDEDEPTQWVVETDQNDGRLLGLYNPVVVRDIDRETEFI